ncbi:MAG: hypothetical protein QOH43_1316 [Solirubrobacteraceae bacterium]|nr:hypothetical protein [Solirubrobacteraceae bacterium]
MDQLALPYRIALLAVLAACALWFVALRPKAEATDSTPLPTPSAATAPGTKGLGTAVDKAKGAVATSDAAAKASEQAANAASTGSTLSPRPSTTAAGKPAATKAQPATPAATKPAATKVAAPKAKPAKPATPAQAAKPAAAPAVKAKARAKAPAAGTTDRSAPLLAALAKGRVAVVLFLDARAADDKAVRAAVHQATKGRAKVTTRIAPISDVGDYAAITQGVAVAQAPTVLIIGPDKKAQVLTGYVDAASITQAISQAR